MVESGGGVESAGAWVGAGGDGLDTDRVVSAAVAAARRRLTVRRLGDCVLHASQRVRPSQRIWVWAIEAALAEATTWARLAEAEEHKKASVSLHAHAAALQTKADLAQAHHPADPEPLPNLF